MRDGPLVWLVLLLLVFFGLWELIGRATGVDLSGWFRERWFSFEARRWEKQSDSPNVLKRTYWTVREFQRDQRRLVAIGYKLVDQSSPQRGAQEFVLGPRRSRYRRRLPAFYITYERPGAA